MTTLNFRVNKITSTASLPRVLSLLPNQSTLNDTSARNPSLFVKISVSQTCKVNRNDQETNEFSLILDNGCFELKYQAESLEQKEIICDLLERMIRGEVVEEEEGKNNEQQGSIENNSSHSDVEHEEKSKPLKEHEEEEEGERNEAKFQPQPPTQTKKDRFLRSKHKTPQKVIETPTHPKHSQNEESEIEINSSNDNNNNNNSVEEDSSFPFDASTSSPQNIAPLKHKLAHSSHIKAEQEASLFLQKLLHTTYNQAVTMVEGVKQKNKDKDKGKN